MTSPCIIAIDAMGGDFGPSVTVPAAAEALREAGDITFIFYGDEGEINKALNQHPSLKSNCRVVHTDKKISSHDKPSAVVRQSKDTSMRLAIEAVAEGHAHAVISAGNTGVLMALSKLILKTMPGIERPAICGKFPTQTGGVTFMLDLGANLECDANVLVQFAILGSVYARIAANIKTPRVGLLNVGTEDMKGHEEVRAASALLSSMTFNADYVGFIEGTDITNGQVDVVVTDGFTGNVALKTAEGMGKLISHLLRSAFKSSWLAKIAFMLAAHALKNMKEQIDPRKYNGGLFLGLNGVCVKSHGGSDIAATKNAILLTIHLVRHKFNDQVAEEIRMLSQSPLAQAGQG